MLFGYFYGFGDGVLDASGGEVDAVFPEWGGLVFWSVRVEVLGVGGVQTPVEGYGVRVVSWFSGYVYYNAFPLWDSRGTDGACVLGYLMFGGDVVLVRATVWFRPLRCGVGYLDGVRWAVQIGVVYGAYRSTRASVCVEAWYYRLVDDRGRERCQDSVFSSVSSLRGLGTYFVRWESASSLLPGD